MIEQAKAVAQRLREHDLHYSDQESAASTIDELVADAEQYKADWKACTAMNRELLAEVERLKQEQDCGCSDQTDCTGACCVKQEQAEPVMFAWKRDDGTYYDASGTEHSKGMHPLYAATKHEQAEPVGRLMSWKGRGTYPAKGYTVARTWEECPKGAYPEDWEEGALIYAAPKGQTELLKQCYEALEPHHHEPECSEALDAIRKHLGEV